MVKRLKSPKHSKLPYVIGAVVLLVIAGSLYAYHVHIKKKPIATVNQYTKGITNQRNSSLPASKQATNAAGSPSDSKTGGVASAALVTPTGNFVSNHHPNLGGSPAPNSMTSVCNTSPGANCRISFTNGGTSKSLSAQVTDAGGATYWNWKLQDIGLTAGDWRISATSSLNGQTLSSTDPMTLTVSE